MPNIVFICRLISLCLLARRNPNWLWTHFNLRNNYRKKREDTSLSQDLHPFPRVYCFCALERLNQLYLFSLSPQTIRCLRCMHKRNVQISGSRIENWCFTINIFELFTLTPPEKPHSSLMSNPSIDFYSENELLQINRRKWADFWQICTSERELQR